MGNLILGCSGWNYPDTADKGGWTGVFYPDKDTKRLRYYSQFFNTAEMDSTFYEKFYSHMTRGTFIGMSRATPEKFQFSIKVPETVAHVKRLDIKKGAMTSFEEFLDKISPLKTANKLGAILFQLPPSFTINDFKNIEQFLDKLPPADSYDYAVEFKHPFGCAKLISIKQQLFNIFNVSLVQSYLHLQQPTSYSLSLYTI